MSINPFSVRYRLLFVVATCLFSVASIRAQTFTGQNKLPEVPTGLEAVVYPVTTIPGTLNVMFNNRTPGGVHVVIRNEIGRKIYDEYETTRQYRRRFDLSSMPAGNYIVELSKRNGHFVQTFTIEPPTISYITMGNRPVEKKTELPVDKKLIVSY